MNSYIFGYSLAPLPLSSTVTKIQSTPPPNHEVRNPKFHSYNTNNNLDPFQFPNVPNHEFTKRKRLKKFYDRYCHCWPSVKGRDS